MTSQPSLRDYAYLAGLLDGDGHFSIQRLAVRRGSRTYQVYNARLRIKMCGRQAVDWCQSKFGGSVNKYPGGKPGWRDQYEWCLFCKPASDLAAKVAPFLHLKREQALLLVEHEMFKLDLRRLKVTARAKQEEKARRENVSQRLRLLTRRGA